MSSEIANHLKENIDDIMFKSLKEIKMRKLEEARIKYEELKNEIEEYEN